MNLDVMFRDGRCLMWFGYVESVCKDDFDL